MGKKLDQKEDWNYSSESTWYTTKESRRFLLGRVTPFFKIFQYTFLTSMFQNGEDYLSGQTLIFAQSMQVLRSFDIDCHMMLIRS